MSKAGINSNRGDGYQTLVAFDWALAVLKDPDCQWMEVDSVTWSVDDVVVGKTDGSIICCQCKKNQTQFRAWSISDLKDELYKAINLLTKHEKSMVYFYSRNNFGDLHALKEFSSNYADESSYQKNLGKAHRATDSNLNLLIENKTNISTYQILKRIKFIVSPELDDMEALLRERLRYLVSSHTIAYDAIWTRLDQLGMRISGQGESISTQYRLTKDDLKSLINKAGSILAPPIEIEDIRSLFQRISAIGRSWRRDVGNEYISNPTINELLEAIEAKHRSILLTGIPGSGKTCTMLAIQDKLEKIARSNPNLQPLFIQSREFADIITSQDRQAQGLPEDWIERAARMAEEAHVVVMIDSLDVLSIAREHSVLTYFLAQIDRLLLIPDITVITSCREFDSRYDRRIAHRSWDKKIVCKPLDWDVDIQPLLIKFGINVPSIESTTRELIRNPRELCIFVELAQKTGGFNAVTSQALAQRYLAVTVQDNSALGDAAMQAIENMATEMLKLRSLSVPYQRFTASQEIKRILLSNKVLHETQDGHLTFGHQTLLDVLVVSNAIRQAVTLNEFIKALSPVPFVRPSIRSFVVQLMAGDRRELRKQLRTVLTSTNAFHIRRLVAETYAEQTPHDDDWPLIRDLRDRHKDIFQVIYIHANKLEWHYFWMKNLLPVLRNSQELEALSRHAHRVSTWKNDDAIGAIALWSEALKLDGLDKIQLVNSIARYIEEINIKHLPLCSPLIIELLKFPKGQHSILGHAVARAVEFGNLEDAFLWEYISGDINDDDALAFQFNDKLHCNYYNFGNKNEDFLKRRMKESTSLLDLALSSIERWSHIKAEHYGGECLFNYGLLQETSYSKAHTKQDFTHVSNERFLLDAIESAILHHAHNNSSWWKHNCERLCFNIEGAIRYFAILSLTAKPTENIELIGRVLRDKLFLESVLSYELGTLIQAAFLYLNAETQNTINETILSIHNETSIDPAHRIWMLKAQAELILTIPCYLRSPDALAVLGECEKTKWPLTRQPAIHMCGGTVTAPFSFEVFLDANDVGILRLLNHYSGYEKNSFDDFLLGGEREVGRQLQIAASHAPSRLIVFLSSNWVQISDIFRNQIMDGIATYLARRYGNLSSNDPWSPRESPESATLTQQIFNELRNHTTHWHHNRAASKVIEASAHVITELKEISQLVSLAADFLTLEEDSSISGDSISLITTGINMAKGNIAEALMILANRLDEEHLPWPDSLPNTLRLFAADKDPAIRVLILRRLPFMQRNRQELGWELFSVAMLLNTGELWIMAEPCLYYAYHQKFEIVGPWLDRIYHEGEGKGLEVWGRISALAALSNRLDFFEFLEKLQKTESIDAWYGASSVWTHASNFQQHKEQCLKGLEAGLKVESRCAIVVARALTNLYRDKTPLIYIPAEFLQLCLRLFEKEIESKNNEIFGLDAWLNAMALKNPMLALEATEIYLDHIRRTKAFFYNHSNNLTQLLTRIFEQAEEQEELDNGNMLQRAVAVQDTLLAMGVNGMDEWLKAAER